MYINIYVRTQTDATKRITLLCIRAQGNYSDVMEKVEVHLQFAIIRATNLCLCGPGLNEGVQLRWSTAVDFQHYGPTFDLLLFYCYGSLFVHLFIYEYISYLHLSVNLYYIMYPRVH